MTSDAGCEGVEKARSQAWCEESGLWFGLCNSHDANDIQSSVTKKGSRTRIILISDLRSYIPPSGRVLIPGGSTLDFASYQSDITIGPLFQGLFTWILINL